MSRPLSAARLPFAQEAHELLHRLEEHLTADPHNDHPLPMFTSCCPGWIAMVSGSVMGHGHAEGVKPGHALDRAWLLLPAAVPGLSNCKTVNSTSPRTAMTATTKIGCPSPLCSCPPTVPVAAQAQVEKQFPDLIPYLSTCKSPQMMGGALIKTFFANMQVCEYGGIEAAGSGLPACLRAGPAAERCVGGVHHAMHAQAEWVYASSRC
jgi:hypothetical protein